MGRVYGSASAVREHMTRRQPGRYRNIAKDVYVSAAGPAAEYSYAFYRKIPLMCSQAEYVFGLVLPESAEMVHPTV